MNPELPHCDELIALRHKLHAHPELSEQEQNTAKIIKAYIGQYKPHETIENIGGHGIAFIYKGQKPGHRILVRAELDALPILEENNDLNHISQTKGVSHKCGHDGHMAMVAGLAKLLHDTPLEKGEVILLFQPAEENGKGAHNVCTDPAFKNIAPDYVFALHNIPGEEFGKIICRSGPFTSSVESLIAKIKGSTSHAAEPNKASSAGEVMAKIMSWTYGLNTTKRDNEAFQRASLVRAITGDKDAYGTTAGDGELHYTLRAHTRKKLTQLISEIKRKIENEINEYNTRYDKNLSVSFEHIEPFMPCINDQECADIIKSAAQEHNLNYQTLDTPYDWGEDFGYFTNLKNVKGALFGLGGGTACQPLHHPLYDFPDTLLPKGTNMFYSIIKQLSAKQ